MKISLNLSVLTCLILCTASYAGETQKHSYVPPNGFVPDAKTASRIAEAVWGPIYGESKIADEKPFNATLEKDVWTVTGSLPKGLHGGVALVEISKTNGTIIRVSHGK